jgi:hypothetical protein
MSRMTKEFISKYINLVKSNDSDGLRKLYIEKPISIDDSYQKPCSFCDCGYISNISIKSYLLNESQQGFPNTKFNINTTYETYKTLVALGILKSTDIEFLFEYFICPCKEQFDRACEIFDLFDKEAIRDYKDEYNQTVFQACLFTHYMPSTKEHIKILNRILECKIEICPTTYSLLAKHCMNFDPLNNIVIASTPANSTAIRKY